MTPVVVIVPPDTKATLNHTILLTCFGYGIPNPAVSWSVSRETLYNGSQVTIYSNLVEENGIEFVRSTLQLCNTAVSDEGEYACELMNAVGSSHATISLDVLGKHMISLLYVHV